MDKQEEDVQKALGLVSAWDVFVRYRGERCWTIYIIDARNAREAVYKVLKHVRTFRPRRRIRRASGLNRWDVFPVAHVDPPRNYTDAKYATKQPVQVNS